MSSLVYAGKWATALATKSKTQLIQLIIREREQHVLHIEIERALSSSLHYQNHEMREGDLGKKAFKHGGKKENKGKHQWIPLNPRDFFEAIMRLMATNIFNGLTWEGDRIVKHEAVLPQDFKYKQLEHAPKKLSFVDCGCGIGNIIDHIIHFYAVSKLFGRVDGIEYNPHLVRAAVRKFRKRDNPKVNIIEGDIIEFKDYSKYDVLYYYCPLSDGRETDFEHHLENTMKVGAVILPFLKRSREIFMDNRFVPIPLANQAARELKKSSEEHRYLSSGSCAWLKVCN